MISWVSSFFKKIFYEEVASSSCSQPYWKLGVDFGTVFPPLRLWEDSRILKRVCTWDLLSQTPDQPKQPSLGHLSCSTSEWCIMSWNTIYHLVCYFMFRIRCIMRSINVNILSTCHVAPTLSLSCTTYAPPLVTATPSLIYESCQRIGHIIILMTLSMWHCWHAPTNSKTLEDWHGPFPIIIHTTPKPSLVAIDLV
jgi:hypothetical protein